MKLLPALAIALGLLAAGCEKHPGTAAVTPTPAEGRVTLTLAPPEVGSVETKHSKKSTDVEITVNGQHVPMHIEEITVEHVEYREVTDVPQKVLVTYDDDHKTTTMQGQDKIEATPLEHHAYVVWKEGGKITATHDDGSAVTADELDKLTSRFQTEIGQVPGIAKILAGRSWKIGEAYTLDPDDLVVLIAGKDGDKVTAGTFTLTGQDGGNGIFDFKTANELDNDKVKGTLDAHVTATIQLSPARPIEAVTEGKIDAVAGGFPFTGTLRGTDTYAY